MQIRLTECHIDILLAQMKMLMGFQLNDGKLVPVPLRCGVELIMPLILQALNL